MKMFALAKNKVRYIVRQLPELGFAYFKDIRKWIRYSISPNIGNRNRSQEQASMLLLLHSLEKGMSLDNVKNGFGKSKADTLLRNVKQYYARYGSDDVCILALTVLKKFLEHPASGKSAFLSTGLPEFLKVINTDKQFVFGGVKPIDKVNHLSFSDDFDSLFHVASTRSSVRSFSDVSISQLEINRAIKYAQTAPSVCNRQTSRVHIFEGDRIQSVLDTQLGNQGWAHKADKLFVITTDLNYFGSVYERNQCFIDGGMFAMQFTMGLHVQKLASCCKMYIRKPSLDKEFHRVTKIPQNEVPIMLILAGHYKDQPVLVPYSHRLNYFNQAKIPRINE